MQSPFSALVTCPWAEQVLHSLQATSCRVGTRSPRWNKHRGLLRDIFQLQASLTVPVPSWCTKDQTEGSWGSSKALVFSIHAPQASHNFITVGSLVLGEPGSRTGLWMT